MLTVGPRSHLNELRVHLRYTSDRDALRKITHAVKAWSSKRNSNISVDSYDYELTAWMKLAGIRNVRSIMEIGAGNGFFLAWAIATGFAESGVGIDPAMPEHDTGVDDSGWTDMLAGVPHVKGRITFRCGTFADWLSGTSQQKYDLIIFRHSLHHIYERRADRVADAAVVKRCISDLARAGRLTSDKGRLYLLESSKVSYIHGLLYNWYRKMKGSGAIDWNGKRSRDEWEAILAAAGYRHMVSTPVPTSKWIRSPFGRFVGRYLSPSFLITATVG